MRATQTTTFRSLQTFLDKTSDRMSTLRIQAATGKRLNRASDDPTAISPVLSSRTQILSSERYILTMSSGLDKTENTDGHLENAEELMQRVKEITISGINGSLSDADMQTFADEISLLKDQLLATANAQVNGKYLFSGYETDTIPFVENPAYDPLTYDPTIYDPVTNPPPVLYMGDAGKLNLEIGPNEQAEVAVDGGRLFLGLEDTNDDGVFDSSDNVVGLDMFHQLTTLEAALRSNDATAIEGQLDTLDATSDQLRKFRSILGNIGKRLETSMGRMEESKVAQQAILSRYEDADLVDAITSLQQQEASFEAALNVTSKVSELSILKYL